MSSSSTRSGGYENKTHKTLRNILSFLLFISVSMMIFSACLRFYIINPKTIEGIFLNKSYVSSLCDDILTNAKDECDKAGLPYDIVDETINYSTVYDIQNAYISGSLGSAEEYTGTTYLTYVNTLGDELLKNTKSTIKQGGYTVDSDVKDGDELFVTNICNYLKNRVEFKHSEKISTIVNVGKTASVIALAVSAVIAFLLILIIASLGKVRYRSIRYISYSFMSSGFLGLCSVAGVELIKLFKDLVLYPMYFSASIMRYVSNCEICVTIFSLFSILISLLVSVAVWKIKRNNS